MKKVVKLSSLFAGAVLMLAPISNAAPRFYFGEGKELEIFFANQLWAMYTMDRVECTQSNNQVSCMDIPNRLDFLLRRSRVGFQGKINEDLTWRVWFAYDNVGLDPHNAIARNNNIGIVNTNSTNIRNREFYLWDAFFTYSFNKTWANLTVGYFRPQVGRESITAGFETTSFEKTLPNFYPRIHIVGNQPGREVGVNLGGLYHDDKKKWGINYNFGVFNTDLFGTDRKWSPMYAARVAVTLGDPEMKKYGLGYKVNYFGKRNGITAAVNYTYQGDTDIFSKNELIGYDILANYGNFNFNAEYDIMLRSPHTFQNGSFVPRQSYRDVVWHIRAGYNINLPNKTVLEPAFNYSELKLSNGSPFGNKDGKLKVYDFGLFWYIKQNNLRLNVNYVKQDGSARSPYSQFGRDQMGDYLGVALQLIY